MSEAKIYQAGATRTGLKSFAGVERFLAEVSGDSRRAGYAARA